MIIDLILDRYDGDAYDPKEFYDAVMDYEEGTEYPISRALDGGEEEDVKRELCAYIGDEYNPNIKKFINAVKWLEGDDGKDYSKEIDIMAEKKESIGKEDDDKLTFKLTEIPKELNHVYRACKQRFWCEPVLNNMVETGDHDVYNFSGEYGSNLELLVVVEHTPDKYYVTVKGLDDTEGYEYVELGKGEADTIQKATADAMAGVDKNMLPLAIKINRAIKGESKKGEKKDDYALLYETRNPGELTGARAFLTDMLNRMGNKKPKVRFETVDPDFDSFVAHPTARVYVCGDTRSIASYAKYLLAHYDEFPKDFEGRWVWKDDLGYFARGMKESKKSESFVYMGADFNPEFLLARTFDEIMGHTNDDIVIEDAEVAEALGKYVISDILADSVSETKEEFVDEVETLLSGSPLDGSPFGASEASDFAAQLWNNSTKE